MTDEAIPLVDLAAQHAEVADAVDAVFREVFRSTAFVNGPAVEAFEGVYVEFVGVRHCVGVSNGTDALELALRSCGVESGDEVLVPANSFVATAESVARIGAIPVFVDVDSTSLLIDPQEVKERLSPRTRAVVPVHLYGQMAPMQALADVLEVRRRRRGRGRRAGARRTPGESSRGRYWPGRRDEFLSGEESRRVRRRGGRPHQRRQRRPGSCG